MGMLKGTTAQYGGVGGGLCAFSVPGFVKADPDYTMVFVHYAWVFLLLVFSISMYKWSCS